MYKRTMLTGAVAIACALAMSMSAYADDIPIPEALRAYGDAYYTGSWQWIDKDGDGMAECYYFGPFGTTYTSTTTPDGYTVNEYGQWTVDGVVQTQPVEVSNEPVVTTTTDLSTGVQTITTADYDFRRDWLHNGVGASQVVADNGGYNEQGVSNSLLYMYTHSQEENKKFGELLVFTGTGTRVTVYYKNGFCVVYPLAGSGTTKFAGQDASFTPNPDYSYSFKYWDGSDARTLGDKLLASGAFSKDALHYYYDGGQLSIVLADGSVLGCNRSACGF